MDLRLAMSLSLSAKLTYASSLRVELKAEGSEELVIMILPLQPDGFVYVHRQAKGVAVTTQSFKIDTQMPQGIFNASW